MLEITCIECKTLTSSRWYGKLSKLYLCRKCYRKRPSINKHEKEVNYKYRLKNREEILLKKKKYYLDNIEIERKRRMEYEKKRLVNDEAFKILKNVRTRVRSFLRNKVITPRSSITKNIGINSCDLKLYIESKWQSGMFWGNYGLHGWHIDHIKPLSSFTLTNEDELKKACHYTNLQPLWAKDNLSKGAKYEDF